MTQVERTTASNQSGWGRMSDRMATLFDGLERVRQSRFPISVAKAKLVTRAFQESEGKPQVQRVAHAFATVLSEIPVFIEEHDLIAGNLASVPGGLELSCLWATWSEAELDALDAAGFMIDPDDRPAIREMNAYWQNRSLTSRMTSLYDDQHLWPYAQLGVVLPPFRSKEEGWGPGGMLGCGWGIHHEISQIIGVFDYERVLKEGLNALIAEAEEKLAETRLFSADAVARADLLRAILVSLRAIVAFAGRLADAAEAEAARTADPARKAELNAIADACRRVPAEPARTFREALQSMWIIILSILPAGILSFGRLDQLLYPYYAADLEAGRITREQALEFFQWLRIKDSQIVITSGQTHRNKYGGLAKWHNLVIGGQDAEGNDVTNDLTYLILEAAATAPCPHPTLTMRVHEGTPPELMDTALRLIGTGIGLPALLSDKSCIEFLEREGIDLPTAREYAVAGCLAVNIVAESRMVACPMFVAPLVLNFALHGGVDPRTGQSVGPQTPRLDECADFETFYAAVKTQLAHFIKLQAEFNNVTIQSYGERYPQPVESALTKGGIGADKNVLGRTLRYENGSGVNPIGLINVSDSLVAVKKLVFEDKSVAAADLLRHLKSDWAGDDGARALELALAAPKFGNDDEEADRFAREIYDFAIETITAIPTVYGGFQKGSAITIGTCVLPAGVQAGATPDGRRANESIADESVTPMRGRDTKGLGAALRSAAKIDQAAWQSIALDVRIHPSLLADDAERGNVARTIHDYFAAGGKHMQFNAVDNATLRAAQADPDAYRDLIVRIGGCSAYFTQLNPQIQDELIERSEYATLD